MSLARLTSWEDEIVRSLSPRWRCIAYESVGSTMDAAKSNQNLIAPHNLGLVVAQSQVSGRGRLGRGWTQSEGAFYGTFILPYEGPLGRLSGFSLAVGLGIHRTLRKLRGNTFLKWPNDILSVNDKKLGGILIEIAPQQSSNLHCVLVGIGINLGEIPQEVERSASLLSIGGTRCTAPAFASLVGQELEQMWGVFKEGGFAPFREEWMSAACWIGARVTVGDGADKREGVLRGVNDEGELLLEEGGGTARIVSGDLGKLRKAE